MQAHIGEIEALGAVRSSFIELLNNYSILMRNLFLNKEKHRTFRQSSMDYYATYLNRDSWARNLKIDIDRRLLQGRL